MTAALPLMTARLTLHPFEPGDVPAFVQNIIRDDAVWNEISGGVVDDPEHEVAQLIAGWEGEPHPPLAVTRTADDVFMGYVALLPVAGAEHETELTIALGSPYRGKGYATEAAHKMLHVAFHQRRLAHIYGLMHPYNTHAKKLATRLNMSYEGVMRDFRYGEELAVYMLRRATYISLHP
ncbi:MAG: GNAT family N-acetyltransferase [Chloroflexota bacterium]